MKNNTRPTPQETDEDIDRIVAEFNDEMKRRGTYWDNADEDPDDMTVVIGGPPNPKQPTPKGGGKVSVVMRIGFRLCPGCLAR